MAVVQAQTMLALAKKALAHSHSPYSGFRVSAVLESANGKFYSGVNIENASYGATVCAERVAIWKAISEGERRFQRILILVDARHPWAPCGLCRQVMSEFMGPSVEVILASRRGISEKIKFGRLMPKAFLPKDLK